MPPWYRECSEIVGRFLLDSNGESEKMKCTIAVISLSLLFLAGCGGTQQVAVPTERLELISMTPLPPVSLSSYATEMRLIVVMHILQDGSVENMRMLGSSGDSDWDSLALQVMRQWRYDPLRRDGVPIDVWIHQPLVIQVQEPIVMTIGALVSASLREADSLCLLLEKATDLDPLFKQAIGTFDIGKYPPNVRDQLKRLRRGENTNPLRAGDKYVIYKRFR
jgi:TonB family protein